MESIQGILDKVNSIYQQGIHSKIDQDLLLDYTRRFYEQISAMDLNMPEFSIADAPEINNKASANAHFNDRAEDPIIVGEPTGNTNIENTTPEETIEQPADIVPEHDNTEEADMDTKESGIEDEDLQEHDEASETVTLSDEEQLEENLMLQGRNISFEPPHPAEESPLFLSDGIEEDQVEENVLPPQSIPVENPLIQQKEEAPAMTDYAKIFNFSTAATATTTDIRKRIGINDKYLFLNELFNSDKSAYEKALDHINKITQYSDAVDWVKDNPAMTYRWHDDDDTVLDFYEVLRKHFNDK